MTRRSWMAAAGGGLLTAISARAAATGTVRSDIAPLKRVIVDHSPVEPFVSLYNGELRLGGVFDAEALDREQTGFETLLRQHGAEAWRFGDLLDEAIAEARRRGHFRTWLRAAVPQLAPRHEQVNGAMLLGTAKEVRLDRDEDGSYRQLMEPTSSLFVRDMAVMTPRGAILCNFLRERRVFSALLLRFAWEYSPRLREYPVAFDAIEEQEIVEGGDVQVVDNDTLFIGVGHRSSPRVAPKLARRLSMNVLAVEMRKGESVRRGMSSLPGGFSESFLHLDTVFTQVNEKHALALPLFLEKKWASKNPLTRLLTDLKRVQGVKESDMDALAKFLDTFATVTMYKAGSGETDSSVKDMKLVDYVRSLGWKLSYVGGTPPSEPDLEFLVRTVFREHEFQAANVVAVAPGKVLAYEGARRTHESLRAAGVEVHPFAGYELRRGNGGPHCLTLPLVRG